VGVDFECVPLDLVCFTLAISKIMRDIFCAFFLRKAGAGISAKYLFCAFFLRKGGSGNLGKIFILRIFSEKKRESWQNRLKNKRGRGVEALEVLVTSSRHLLQCHDLP
jgi:hypothetical protein